MSSYLDIARTVLGKSKVPLSAKQILDAAYRLQLVPEYLFGKTQHKTLHARLSEELKENKQHTLFARTSPGRFWLRQKLNIGSDTISEYIAPRREYQLRQFDVVCAKRDDIAKLWPLASLSIQFSAISPALLLQLPLQQVDFDVNIVYMRILVVLRSSDKVFTLNTLPSVNLGSGRSLGLLGYIKGSDADLFSSDPWGIDNAARRTIAEQSTFSSRQISTMFEADSTTPLHCIRPLGAESGHNNIVLMTSYTCSDPNEMLINIPFHRMPRWLHIPREVNDLDTLDPLSKLMLSDDQITKTISSSHFL